MERLAGRSHRYDPVRIRPARISCLRPQPCPAGSGSSAKSSANISSTSAGRLRRKDIALSTLNSRFPLISTARDTQADQRCALARTTRGPAHGISRHPTPAPGKSCAIAQASATCINAKQRRPATPSGLPRASSTAACYRQRTTSTRGRHGYADEGHRP